MNLTKDLKYLVKTGTVEVSELMVLWTSICDEYRQLIKDIDSNYGFDLQKETFRDDKLLITTIAIVNQLKLRRNEELIAILKKDLDFRMNYVDLDRDLEKTLKQAKFRSVLLRQKENEYKIHSETTEQKNATEYDFMEQLDIISEMRGYHLKIDDLTVLEYTAIYNRFRRDLEQRLKNA